MTSPFSRQAVAAAWAAKNLSKRDWDRFCQLFVEQAYNQQGQYPSALAAGNALLGPNPNRDLAKATPGDLVFFSADDSNSGFGHAGIYVGNGKMVSATNTGTREESILSNPYWAQRFRGTASPPPQWGGRPTTQDIMEGAALFQQEIEKVTQSQPSSSSSSPLIEHYTRQAADKKAALAKIEEDKRQADDFLARYNALPSDKQATYDQNTLTFYQKVQRDYAKTSGDAKTALAKAEEDLAQERTKPTAPASDTRAPSGSTQEKGGRVYWFPSDGGPAKDVTPPGYQPGQEVKVREIDRGGEIILWDDATGKEVGRFPKTAAPQQPRSADQQRADAANATTAEAKAEEARITIERIKTKIANGTLDAQDAADLEKAALTIEQMRTGIEASRDNIRTPEERALDTRAKEAQIAQSQSNTKSDTMRQLEEELARLQIDEKRVATAAAAKKDELKQKVVRGEISPADAMLEMGEYAEFLKTSADLQTKQQTAAQDAVESYGRYGVATGVFQAPVLSALAPITGIEAAAKSMGKSMDDPIVRGVQNALSSFYGATGLGNPQAGASGGSGGAGSQTTQSAAAGATTAPAGWAAAQPMVSNPGVPASGDIDYSAAQQGLNDRTAAGAPSGIGAPPDAWMEDEEERRRRLAATNAPAY